MKAITFTATGDSIITRRIRENQNPAFTDLLP